MKTYTLKSAVRRGSLLGAAFALVVATVVPVASTYADALNPLTERSLTLSSGSPGWSFTDASGNATYAPPNSGANGQKTGNTFSFRVSSTADIKGMNFQYCTTPAGDCMGPGNNGWSGAEGSYTRFPNDATRIGEKKSDLEVVTHATTGEISPATYGAKFNATLGQPNTSANYDPDTVHPNMPDADGSEGNFIVLHRSSTAAPWVQSTGWTMTATERQTYQGSAGVEADGHTTKKNNYIKLSNAAGSAALTSGDYVKVIFFATDHTYITNPGAKEFFVKINTYKDATLENDANLVDGGVTVANVMNRSIEIQTKVLETMDFSVGTVDPNTLDSTGGVGSQFQLATGKNTHSPCDPIVQGMTTATTTPNVLKLGDETGEFSLRTDTTYSTHSYWRLSSNSSGGATVYYSGVTLSNTVGDQIKAIGKTAAAPQKGAEQFGLALDNNGSGEVSYAKERTPGYVFQNGEDNNVTGLHSASLIANNVMPDGPGTGNASWHAPTLAPLTADPNYANGTGVVNNTLDESNDPVYGASINTAFAFDPESSVIPTPFAQGTQVLDCVTGKMRYIANIAATTPAGIYTTKINYIAAPKY